MDCAWSKDSWHQRQARETTVSSASVDTWECEIMPSIVVIFVPISLEGSVGRVAHNA